MTGGAGMSVQRTTARGRCASLPADGVNPILQIIAPSFSHLHRANGPYLPESREPLFELLSSGIWAMFHLRHETTTRPPPRPGRPGTFSPGCLAYAVWQAAPCHLPRAATSLDITPSCRFAACEWRNGATAICRESTAPSLSDPVARNSRANHPSRVAALASGHSA